MGPEKTVSSYSQTNRDLFGLQRHICVRWQLLGCRLLWTFIFLLTLNNAKESLCKFKERDGKHFPACTPWNYVISKSGPCVNATRSIHFEKAESELFSCRGPASFVVENQSCKCMLDEYRPTIVAPDRVESFSPGTDECIAEDSVVKQLTSKLTYSSWALAECDLEDVGFELLKCNAATQTRAGVFYWKRPCDAILDLPGPVEVPCKVTCPAGEFAKKPTLECDVCPAGTFSIPGTVYGPVWDEEKWPASFHNFDRGPGIERWHIVDGLLKSNHVMWNSHSKLKFMTTIISPISFLTLNYQIVARESNVSFDIRVNQHSLHWTSAKTESLSDLQLILSNELEICEWKAVSNGTQMCMTSDPYGKEKFKEGAYSGIGVFNPLCDISDFERIVPEGVQNFMFFILANNVHMYSNCDIAHQVTNAALVKGVQGIILGSNVLMNLEAFNTTVPVGYAKPNELFRYRSDSAFAFMLKQETRDVEVHTEIELSAHRFTVHASSFDDGVYLRSILIHGTQSSAETCTECPPGYASHQGSQQCDICPKNTFADRPGMAWPCQPCPPNTFAPPGSLHCIPMATCGKNDYVAHLTKCLMREGERGDVKYRQKLEYSLIKPPTCNPEVESDFIPDTSREVLCRSCSNGLVRKGGACTPCGVGEIANTKENECTACPHGTYANRMLNYEDFSALEGEFPANWTLECKTCLGPGWHIIPDASNSEDSEVAPRVHIVSGHGFGHDSVAHLDIPVEVQGVGSVTFKYEFIRPVGFAAGDVYGTFTILGEIAGNVSESEDLKVSTNGSPISLHLPLVQEGKGVLRWTWGIANGLSHSSHTKRPTLILYSLSVQGERSGGAYECVDCPPGSQCKAGVITRCPAGTYRNGHMHQCESCPKGLVAERSGHRECTECPIGTVATADGTQCYLAETRLDIYSVWKHVPVKYDLAMLEQRLGPFPMGSLQGQKLVINLTNQFSRSGLQDCGLEVSSPYVCVTSENAGQSDINDPRVGESIASIATVMHSPSSYGDDVTIMVHSKQPCSQNVGSFQQTHITLKCEEDTIFYSQQPTGHVIGNVTSWDNCSAQVTLTSPFLCPFCSSVNCENFRGPCIDGVRRVYFGCERVCRQENGEATSMKRSYREESCSALGKLSGRRNLLGSVILLTLLCMLWLLVIAQYLYISRKQLRSVIAQLNQERVPGDLLFSPVRN